MRFMRRLSNSMIPRSRQAGARRSSKSPRGGTDGQLRGSSIWRRQCYAGGQGATHVPRRRDCSPRFDRYQEVSTTLMEVFSKFSPEVEALSLDEAFLDMTGSEQLFGEP